LLHGETLHVATTQDAVYTGSAGVLLAPPAGGFRSDAIGKEIDGALQYAWNRIPLVFELGVGHFWPGPLMSANNLGAERTLAYFQLTYIFKIGRGKSGDVTAVKVLPRQTLKLSK
jgi:hypothetical protein